MPEGQSINIACPGCGATYSVDRSKLGHKAKCKKCGIKFVMKVSGDEQEAAPRVLPTIDDARRLWQGSVGSRAQPGMSIKPGSERSSAHTDVVIRPHKMAAASAGGAENDFELIRKLGEGGMGVVFAARQASVDRAVAVKMVHPEMSQDDGVRAKFLTEAVVTGDLDHPNIVPVHELGCSEEGALFYAMKQVKGTSWEEAIRTIDEAENIEILLKVCDAVAFAHDKGVVHRDLKPENVMLGDYGEVLVMDWGLAASTLAAGKAEQLCGDSGPAGTPSYMAPEMAKCEIDKIGPASDVYLLGGILYEIVTGLAPHQGKDVFDCIYRAMLNEIQPTDRKGELVDIARRAMATEPGERYENVKAFQQAIRDYRSHAESAALAAQAQQDAERAEQSGQYDDYAQAVFGFREAMRLWDGNRRARRGLTDARFAYAQRAYKKDDLDLAASLLEPEAGAHAELLDRVVKAQRARVVRQRRIRVLSYGSIALTAGIIAVLSIAFLWVRSEKERAVAAEKEALAALERLRESRAGELLAREAAREARELAGTEKHELVARIEEAEEIAGTEKTTLAEQRDLQDYLNDIRRALDYLEAGNLNEAEKVLWQTSKKHRNWEWGHLLSRCHPELFTMKVGQYIGDFAWSPDGAHIAICGGATAILFNPENTEEVARLKCSGDRHGFTRLAFSPDSKLLATGCFKGGVVVWRVADGERVQDLKGHTDNPAKGGGKLASVVFSPDGKRLLTTGGFDKTARVWDVSSGEQLVNISSDSLRLTCGVFSPDGNRFVTGGMDGAKVWDASTGQLQLAIDTRHVDSVWFSRDGKRIFLPGPTRKPFFDAETSASVPAGEYGAELARFEKGWPRRFSPKGKRFLESGEIGKKEGWAVYGVHVKATDGLGLPLRILGDHLSMSAVAFSPDGKKIAVGSRNGTRICETDTGTVELELPVGGVDLAFLPGGGRLLISADGGGVSKIYEVSTGRELSTFEGGPAAVTPNGDRLVTANRGRVAQLWLWDVNSGDRVLTLKDKGVTGLLAARFSPDANRLLTFVRRVGDRCGLVWDAESGQRLLTLAGDRELLCRTGGVDISRDGKLLAMTAGNGVRVCTSSGESIVNLAGHTKPVTSVAFSPDGRRLLSGSEDGTAKIWHVETGTEILTLKGYEGGVHDVAWSPDGRRLAAASNGKTVLVWEAFDWTIETEQLSEEMGRRYRHWRKRNL